MEEHLRGLRVLDLSLWQPGHTATQLLADLGADVLKIEPPGGDRERVMPDRVANYYLHKRSLVLDLKKDEDRARLHALVADAEVLVEGYRPGVAARLGAGYEQLRAINPALVYCSITGFGQTGPLADAPGHEHNYQAVAGAFVIPKDGGHPVGAKPLVGDQGAGTAAAFAILAAVISARRTGQGEHIDVSMADVIASWVAPAGNIGGKARADDPGSGPKPPGIGEFVTADGKYVVLGIFSEDHFWDRLCHKLGLETAIGLDMGQRAARSAELRALLAGKFAERNRDDLVEDLIAVGLPISPILSREEALDHPHFVARGLFGPGPDGTRRVAHPILYRERPARRPGRPTEVGEDGERGFGGQGGSTG